MIEAAPLPAVTVAEPSNAIIRATGRRKTASARLRLFPNGTGLFTVNGKALTTYCFTDDLAKIVTVPLRTIGMDGKFDIIAQVVGGGPNGQATALSHALARALEKSNPEWRPALKKAGLLRRDPRKKERQKAGQPGARKRFQFSKR